ncbi:hypothetical protein PIB30_076326 [Stylosanthes scabra]|uniref:Uncharacterized protein n=1 Tax=Stylosanthes scabra TaxID=79078 RepID=A0ABU6XNK8_9FABA|nr:hypothetical protein [Stylosanthes scabra]
MPPRSGQFTKFDEENSRGNPSLCGQLLKHKCEDASAPHPTESSNIKDENETPVDMVVFYWSFMASYIIVLLGIVTVLWINAYWRIAWFYFISKAIHIWFPSFPLY